MEKKIVQIILVLVIGFLLIAASPLPEVYEGDDGGERWYCGTTAFDPQPYPTVVRGRGVVACTSQMSWLRIEVDLIDITGKRHWFVSRTCYTTDWCEISSYLDRYNDRWYVTQASGYWPTSDWYDESDWVYITE